MRSSAAQTGASGRPTACVTMAAQAQSTLTARSAQTAQTARIAADRRLPLRRHLLRRSRRPRHRHLFRRHPRRARRRRRRALRCRRRHRLRHRHRRSCSAAFAPIRRTWTVSGQQPVGRPEVCLTTVTSITLTRKTLPSTGILIATAAPGARGPLAGSLMTAYRARPLRVTWTVTKTASTSRESIRWTRPRHPGAPPLGKSSARAHGKAMPSRLRPCSRPRRRRSSRRRRRCRHRVSRP